MLTKSLTNHAFVRNISALLWGFRVAGRTLPEQGLMPTIALVDDDRNILTSVSIALEAEGYRIMTYTDGASALDGFKTSPPDLAILDIKMPRMDGMETLRRLRQKSDMPVIFLTSKDEEIDELFGLKIGADDFIRKPFSQRLLVERVKAILRRSTPKDGSAPKETDAAKVLERGLLRMDPERQRTGECETRDVMGQSLRARARLKCEVGTLAIGKRCQERISATGWAW